MTLEFNPKSTFALEVCRWVKRLDTLEKVTFAASPDIKGLRVVHGGVEHLNVEAFREAARSFPVPFFWRAIVRAPFLGKKLALGLQKPKSASAYLGIEKLVGRDELAPEPSPVRRFLGHWTWPFRELAVLIVMISCASQVLIENRAVPKWLKPEHRPEWMEAIVIYPRLFQGWSMFAPSPPTDDGRLVVDGVTKDGRRFDPLTGQSPDFDIDPKGGFRMNQIWGDFSRRFFEDRFKTYWNGFRDFLRNHHQITGRPEDELEAFDVYWVSEWIPLPGQPRKAPERKKLFSYGDVSRALGKQRTSVPGSGARRIERVTLRHLTHATFHTLRICVPTVIQGALGTLTTETCDERLDSWSRAIVRYARIALDVEGKELIPPGEAFVVMSNHQSLLRHSRLVPIARTQGADGGQDRALQSPDLVRGDAQRGLRGDRSRESRRGHAQPGPRARGHQDGHQHLDRARGNSQPHWRARGVQEGRIPLGHRDGRANSSGQHRRHPPRAHGEGPGRPRRSEGQSDDQRADRSSTVRQEARRPARGRGAHRDRAWTLAD